MNMKKLNMYNLLTIKTNTKQSQLLLHIIMHTGLKNIKLFLNKFNTLLSLYINHKSFNSQLLTLPELSMLMLVIDLYKEKDSGFQKKDILLKED